VLVLVVVQTTAPDRFTDLVRAPSISTSRSFSKGCVKRPRTTERRPSPPSSTTSTGTPPASSYLASAYPISASASAAFPFAMTRTTGPGPGRLV
jgi:hypothetical protein